MDVLRTFNQSIKFLFPATYPPTTPIAFDNVPIWKSTLSDKPKCLTVPAPLPSTPEPCASSTYVIKSNSSAISQFLEVLQYLHPLRKHHQ